MLVRQFIQSVLGLAILATSSFALSNTDFTYNIIDGGIELTGCVETCPTNLTIPEVIDGYSVTHIGDYAFNEKQLTNVELPNTLTFIGWHAFAANQLTEITIPDSVTIINSDAFEYNQLVTVIFGKNVTEIRGAAFRGNNISGDVFIPSQVTMIRDYGFDVNQINRVYFYGDRPLLRPAAFRNNTITAVFYCSNTTGWPGDAIEGITPVLDEGCDSDDDGVINSEDAFPFDSSRHLSDDQYATFDIDQSGSVDALSDGLILLRYFFGLRGDSLISGAISPDANRTTVSEIEAYIESHMP